MRSKSLVVVFLLILAAVAAFVFFAMSGEPEPAPVVKQGTVAAPAAAPAGAPADAKKRAGRSGRKWVELGMGDVRGVVREYGSEKPLAGVVVSLSATDAGPNRTIETKTASDGSFRLADAPNYEDWTLRVDAPAPLEDVEIGGVTVVEGKRTDLGVVYVSPAFAVEGIVVDEAGAPIEGADVRMLRSATGGASMDILRLIRELHIDPPAVDRAKSGADGKFRLTKTVPGSYDVKVVAAKRRVLVERGVIVTPESAKTPMRYMLEKGFQLEGRVVRKGPGTVQGITVVAFIQPRDQDFLVLDRVFAVTDAEGQFTLDGLGGGRHIVAAVPEGEPFQIRDDVNIPARGPIELVIEGDAWLEGRVTGDGGRGVTGATVFVASFDQSSPLVGQARTDATGAYSIRGLRSGPVQLFLVQAEGYATYPTDLMSALQGGGRGRDVIQPGRNEKNVSLEPGGTVTGVVRIADSETPLEGVRVELVTVLAMFGGFRGATTDSQGRFEITSVPMGESALVLSKDGWFQPGVNAQVLAARFFRGGGKPGADSGKGAALSISQPGQKVERTFEMARGSTVKGKVTRPDGTPVAGARVQLVQESGGEMDEMLRALSAVFGGSDPRLTDAEGNFEVAGPPPGQKARVWAKSQGWLDGSSERFACGIGDVKEGVVVTLRQGALIEGTVKDEKGTPIQGALVRWVKREQDDEWSWQWQLRNATPTLTDAEGRFHAANVETGKVVVEVSHPQYLPDTRRDAVTEEGKSLVIDSKLVLGAVLSGKVIGPDGKPVTGADVSIAAASRDGAQNFGRGNDGATSDAKGLFRAEGLAAGPWTLTARAKGFAPSEAVQVATTTSEVTLRLLPAYEIAGVVRAGGQPVANAQVQLVRIGGSVGGAVRRGQPTADGTVRETIDNETTDAEGRFRFEGVPQGTYELDAGPTWWGESRANILPTTVKEIAAGNVNVAIECTAGLSISGRVFLPDGTNAPAGQVNAQRMRGPNEPPAVGDRDWANGAVADGAFELVGLAAGRWTVTVTVPGYAVRTETVETGARDLRFTLQQGGRVAGRVLNPDGTPAAGVWVNVSGPESGSQGDQTNEEGRFEVQGLAPGACRVDATQWNQETRKRSQAAAEGVDVRADQTTTVPDLTLKAAE